MLKRKIPIRALFIWAALALCLSGPVGAEPIEIGDSSFDETEVVLTLNWSAYLGPWDMTGLAGDLVFAGLYNVAGLVSNVDGANVYSSFYGNGGGTSEVYQALGLIEEGGSYWLTVGVGRDDVTAPADFSFDLTTSDLYGLSLEPLARYEGSASELTGAARLDDFSVNYNIPDDSPLIGAATFAIVLRHNQPGGSGTQGVLFDNVRLREGVLKPVLPTLIMVK